MRLLGKALTFDDVLLVPAYSKVLPRDTSLSTRLSRNITLNLPLVSAAMDTVTEARLAIAIAQEGGIGIIHKNLTAAQQANLKASLAVNTGVLKSADNQLLLAPSTDNRKVPVRPADPNKLPETDPLHWYDMEWAGWSVTPTNIPKSPGDGAIDRRIRRLTWQREDAERAQQGLPPRGVIPLRVLPGDEGAGSKGHG